MRSGKLISLNSLGIFSDKELGRIEGENYSYVFTIHDNSIEIDGSGYIPSLNVTLNGDEKLSYAKNYPWTAFCDVDTTIKADYDGALEHVPNSRILTAQIPNSRDASGGLGMVLDQDDNLSIRLVLNAPHGLDLDVNAEIPLEINRSLHDTIIANITGNGYSYTLQLRGNVLSFSGSGTINVIDQQWVISFGPPPTLNTSVRDGLCYIYRYDRRNRMVEKHIPGNGWHSIVYDKLDRVALTQDSNLFQSHDWLFTKYDAFGRVAYTGRFHFNAPAPIPNSRDTPQTLERKAMQEILYTNTYTFESRGTRFSAGAVDIDYTTNVSPKSGDNLISNFIIYTASYYDDYNIQPYDEPLTLPSINSYSFGLSSATQSLPTASLVRVLETEDWIMSLTGYDDRGRVVWSKSENRYLQTEDVANLNLDYSGLVTESITAHTKAGSTANVTTRKKFTYDNAGRLLKQTSMINDGDEELIVFNRYDELGQLVSKKVGGNTGNTYNDVSGLQEVGYRYNIRGWLSKINAAESALGDKLFAMNIDYDRT